MKLPNCRIGRSILLHPPFSRSQPRIHEWLAMAPIVYLLWASLTSAHSTPFVHGSSVCFTMGGNFFPAKNRSPPSCKHANELLSRLTARPSRQEKFSDSIQILHSACEKRQRTFRQSAVCSLWILKQEKWSKCFFPILVLRYRLKHRWPSPHFAHQRTIANRRWNG